MLSNKARVMWPRLGTKDFEGENPFQLWGQKQPEEQMEHKEVQTETEDRLFM